MKRILPLLGLFGAAVLLLATPGKTHKVDWCHFPPGQWTGNPATSKVNILSIDEAADGSVSGQHLNHTGDGPICKGPGATQVIDGKTYDCADLKIPNVALGANCGGAACPSVYLVDHSPSLTQLVPGTNTENTAPNFPNCVCPSDTLNGKTGLGPTTATPGLCIGDGCPNLNLSCGDAG